MNPAAHADQRISDVESGSRLCRVRLYVRGIVQGVGFRPFVYGLAQSRAVSGFVSNRAGAVVVEVEGDEKAVTEFVDALPKGAPPLARIEAIEPQRIAPLGEDGFRIEASHESGPSDVFVSPDTATCEACLAELFDPSNRRFRYPFLNCTDCGPRLTIVTRVPYDRQSTTMGAFALCAACRAEYDDPRDRRFHAQATACWTCGPTLAYLEPRGSGASGDAVRRAARAIMAGRIVAIKGLGGYHLACDARNDDAVTELRRRKLRDEKPFAIMVRSLDQLERLTLLDAAERAVLLSPARPIVLLHRRTDADVSRHVAPGSTLIGVMLPYAPLHHLLFEAVQGLPLVMTSGNTSDEPMVFQDEVALRDLAPVADGFLVNDREIASRCDDSVLRVVGGQPLFVRRARGYAPLAQRLPFRLARPTLGVGGELKSTFALGREDQAFTSHHIGDLEHYAAFRAFGEAVERYEDLFRIAPERIVHDLHPDYASTRYAIDRAAKNGMTTVAVQHHHAHIAACMAEHGVAGNVIGVAFDGAGYGLDGAIWGGEFFVGGYARFARVAHLAYARMAGGDRAVREPWRMAFAHLVQAGEDPDWFLSRWGIDRRAARVVAQAFSANVNSPPTSSIGRLFDAVSSLVTARRHATFEAQPAIELEMLASATEGHEAYPFCVEGGGEVLVIDASPAVSAVAHDVRDGEAPVTIASRFHATVVAIVADVCARLHAKFGLTDVVLGGGVFMNGRLSQDVPSRLRAMGFQVYRPVSNPPNDGALSLGQLAIVAARDEEGRTCA